MTEEKPVVELAVDMALNVTSGTFRPAIGFCQGNKLCVRARTLRQAYPSGSTRGGGIIFPNNLSDYQRSH